QEKSGCKVTQPMLSLSGNGNQTPGSPRLNHHTLEASQRHCRSPSSYFQISQKLKLGGRKAWPLKHQFNQLVHYHPGSDKPQEEIGNDQTGATQASGCQITAYP